MIEVKPIVSEILRLSRVSQYDAEWRKSIDVCRLSADYAGALGGKILGAGGGGYFLFYVPKEKQPAATATLSGLGLSRLAFHFEPKGSQVIE